MSIKIFKEDNKIGISIFGPYFDELKDILKDHRFYFYNEWKGHFKVWVNSTVQAYETIKELQEVDSSIKVSDEFLESLLPKQETKKYRIPFNQNLLKSKPIGDYQLQGIKKILKQNRLMLAWEMGLGKTFATIGGINHLFYNNLADRILIIGPSESVYNFKREILQFNTFSLKEEEIYVANAENRHPLEYDPKVIIMTYRTLLMLSDDAYKKKKGKKSKHYRIKTLDFENWGTKRILILDESQRVKNVSARQTKVMSLHKEDFEYRYLLTGTPDPNGVNGFYSQVNIMDEGMIGKDYYSWLNDVAKLGTKYSAYGIQYFYPEKVKQFMKKISPLIDRQFAKDNLDLPEQIIKNIYTGLNKHQLDIYQNLVTYTLAVIKEEHGSIIPRKVEEKFQYIQLALDNPSLLRRKISKELSPRLYKQIENWKFDKHSKLDVCSSLIEKYLEQDKKVIIWSGHPLTLNELKEYYKQYKPITIHGQLDIPKSKSSNEYKNELLEEFKTNKDRKILLASYLVLSSAVNIVEAPRSIYFDRSYNSEYWMQSLKRNHRIGQYELVVANPIIFEKTIEERLDRQLKRKDKMNKHLTDADSLSQEEWKELFLGKGIME